jgi:hypothetical protein
MHSYFNFISSIINMWYIFLFINFNSFPQNLMGADA